MPELPEVETIVRYLQPRIRGKRILGVKANTPRLFRDVPASGAISRSIMGKRVRDVSRTGKYIGFALDDGTYLLIHLMMTGKLILGSSPRERKYDRLTLRFSGGTVLTLNDIRKFGRVRLSRTPQSLVGRDPLRITLGEFRGILHGRKGMVKSLLLNQSVLAGIGNIYSDEILWTAGIHPRRKAETLSDAKLRSLYRSCRRVLALAIRKEGSSMRDYETPDGHTGGYYDIRKAYRRAGERCLRDGGIIQRLRVGSRATHFCPVHQT